MKLISVLLVIVLAVPSGLSLASVFSSQYVPEVVAYEQPALRLSNYSINSHYNAIITTNNYNTTANATIQFEWDGPNQNNTFSEVNYSNQILLQTIGASNMDANLTFRSFSGNYNYLANFSVYFVENGTFFKEVSMQSDNGKVVKHNLSQVSLFNRSEPIRIGILFQPVVNSYTEIPGNSFDAEFQINLNLFHVSGNNVEVYTQYRVSVDLVLTT
ncbi:MAG: hypothetical protein M1431_05810 [Candidatus Thermoplasmatota archaeon]|nr:hypothetical protein [Candidatus Thermoplasmatota archaeon]